MQRGDAQRWFDVIELMRNAAIVSGDCYQTNAYRQRCIEKAYHEMCLDLVPRLLELGVLKPSTTLSNLVDTSALHQKHLIRPEHSGARPAFPPTTNPT
jgi:hypothetical protein